MLQRLFRTRRFEEVERWLVERRVELRRGVPDPPGPGRGRRQPDPGSRGSRHSRRVGPARPRPAGRRRLARTLGGGAADPGDRRARRIAESGLDAATLAVAGDQQALDAARALSDARRRGLTARQELETLETSAAEADELGRLSRRPPARGAGAPAGDATGERRGRPRGGRGPHRRPRRARVRRARGEPLTRSSSKRCGRASPGSTRSAPSPSRGCPASESCSASAPG